MHRLACPACRAPTLYYKCAFIPLLHLCVCCVSVCYSSCSDTTIIENVFSFVWHVEEACIWVRFVGATCCVRVSYTRDCRDHGSSQ